MIAWEMIILKYFTLKTIAVIGYILEAVSKPYKELIYKLR